MTASVWTPDRVARLRTLWLEGFSAEEVSRRLGQGISRSAVLGKVHRLGLSAGRPGPEAAPKHPVRRGRTPGAPSSAGMRRPLIVAPSPPVKERPVCDLPSGGFGLLALRRDQCRWPYGEPGAGLSFCGRPVTRGAFCSGHAEVAYRAPPGGSGGLLALAGLV